MPGLRPTRSIAVLLAATLLSTSVLLVRAGPASASDLCPVGQYGSYSFAALTDYKGVSLCVQRYLGADIAYWLVVDFKAGARARIIGQNTTAAGAYNTLFSRRVAADWWTYVQNNVASPSGGSLVDVTNASFFKTSYLYFDTSLSLAFRMSGTLMSAGWDTGYTRRYLGFYGDSTPYAVVGSYNYNGSPYTGNNSAIESGLYTSTRDYQVALGPTQGDTSIYDKRVYVGLKDTDGNGTPDRMIMLRTNNGHDYTLGMASDALGWWGVPEAWRIQLDGGGSRQFYSYNGTYRLDSVDPYAPNGHRLVPNVIAIWQAP